MGKRSITREASTWGFAAALFAAAIACVFAAWMAFVPQTAYAADKDATLTLVVQHEEKGVKRHVSGVEYTIYQVAVYGEGNQYELIDPFTGEKVDFNQTLTAKESIAAAKSMAKTAAAKKLKGKTAKTGADGKAAFGTLDWGVYLVVQTGATGMAEKYYTMDPFLINVPQLSGSDHTYDVVANAKPQLKPVPPAYNTPKTGDKLDWSMVILAAVAGLAAMVLAIVAARKRKKN